MHRNIKIIVGFLFLGITIIADGQTDSLWLDIVQDDESVAVQIDSVLTFCNQNQNQRTAQKLMLLNKIAPWISTTDPEQKASYFLSYSQVNLENENYERTLEYALKANSLTSLIDSRLATRIESHLARVYYVLTDIENSLMYTQKAYHRSLKLKDSMGVASGFSRIGELYRRMGQRDSAHYYIHQAILLWEELGNEQGLARAYNNLGIYHIQTQPSSLEVQNLAIDAWEKSLFHKSNIGDSIGMVSTHLNLAMATGEPHGGREKIEFHLNQALEIAKKLNNIRSLRAVFKDAAMHYYKFGDLQEAYLAQKEYQVYHEALMNETTQKRIAELEIAYETNLKEQNIELLSAKTAAQQNRIQKQQWILVLSSSVLLLFMITLFIVRRNAQLKLARKEQETKLTELIHSKEMEALKQAEHLNQVKVLLHGQEMERKRIAQDLHDQMGAIMSAIKMNLEALDQPNGLDRKERFAKTRALVTTASKEIRQTAHNLMPASIDKYGLDLAIRSDIAQLDQNHLKIHFQSSGLSPRLPHNMEIHIYRIVQEMIQNALKHSGAQELIIDLNVDEECIHLIVEDNGNGFNQKRLEEIEGMGLSNIRSRVVALGGELIIDSKPEMGTSFDIFIIRKEEKSESSTINSR